MNAENYLIVQRIRKRIGDASRLVVAQQREAVIFKGVKNILLKIQETDSVALEVKHHASECRCRRGDNSSVYSIV